MDQSTRAIAVFPYFFYSKKKKTDHIIAIYIYNIDV